MSIQNQFFTSFIKGIAKTTGSLTVLAIAAILWQLYTQENIIIKQRPSEETDQNDLECSFVDCTNTTNEDTTNEDTTNENTNTKTNFKKIFDKI